MTDPENKSKHSRRRLRNFLAKKLRESFQFKKKVHKDDKEKQKERKWRYDETAEEASDDYGQ